MLYVGSVVGRYSMLLYVSGTTLDFWYNHMVLINIDHTKGRFQYGQLHRILDRGERCTLLQTILPASPMDKVVVSYV